MKTILEINGDLVLDLELECTGEVGKQTAKSFFYFAHPLNNVIVLIGDDNELLDELPLHPDISSGGRPIWKNSDNDARYFFWAVISKIENRPGDYGLTVGCIDKTIRATPPPELPGSWERARTIRPRTEH